MDSVVCLQTALRVLSRLTQNTEPEISDVLALEECAGPRPPSMTLEEFAREAVQNAIALRQHESNKKPELGK